MPIAPPPTAGLLGALQAPRPVQKPPREPVGLEAAARGILAAVQAGDVGALAKALGAAIDLRVQHRRTEE